MGCVSMMMLQRTTFAQVASKMLRPCPDLFSFQPGPTSVVSGTQEAGTVGTSGHKRGASIQANYRDSRAREIGPQI